MNGKIVAIAAVGIMLAGQAIAGDARITSVSGSVVASQGGQFAPATASTVISQGDRIVSRGGAAEVRFADGCVVKLKAQTMLTVGASSPCASGSGLISATEGNGAQFGSGNDDDDDDGFVPAALTFAALVTLLILVSEDDDTVSN